MSGKPSKTPIQERIMEKTEPVPWSGCYVWTGPANDRGYGVISYYNKQRYCHRLMFEIANGPIPEGLVVMHKCDNPSCVNPKHLEIGTQRENLLDARRKGRFVVDGERNPMSKLTEEDVVAIKRRLEGGESHDSISKDFNVSRPTISLLSEGRTWRKIGV